MKVNEVKVKYNKQILTKISSVQSAVDYCKAIPEFENRMQYQEVFVAIYLDYNNNIMCHQIISIGAINQTIADIRIIMSTALKTLATSIIICHNHPSGNLKASHADINLTNKVKDAANLFDITLIDHIILTKDSYLSFSNEGMV
jgi:DNA repair protein RadC